MKMPISSVQLTEELRRRGQIRVAELAPASHGDRPWFINVVLGAAGWLAGVFALIFVGLLFEPDTPAGFSLAGVIMLSAAFGLYAVDRENAFFDQLALALSIAGQLALTWAALKASRSEAVTAALVGLLQIVLVFVMPNRFAKLLAALFACLAWALAIRFAWWDESTFESARRGVALAPALICWLLIWVPVVVVTQVLVATEAHWMSTGLRKIARPALSGLILSLSIATWASEPLGSLQFWDTSGEARTNWLVLWPLLGAVAALSAATCAFRLRNTALLGAAIAGALLHVGQFYFLLGTTLLVKSCIMFAAGALLLLAAAQLRRRSASGEVDA